MSYDHLYSNLIADRFARISHLSVKLNPFRPSIHIKQSSRRGRLINLSLIIFWQIPSPLSLTHILIIKPHEKWLPWTLIFISFSVKWALKTIWCHDSWAIPELFLFTQLSPPVLICIRDKVSNSERQDNTQEWGRIIHHHIMSLPTLAMVTCLLGASHVSGTWPVVTWHGAGGTASECDKMIETIRWEQTRRRGERRGVIGIQQLIMAAH